MHTRQRADTKKGDALDEALAIISDSDFGDGVIPARIAYLRQPNGNVTVCAEVTELGGTSEEAFELYPAEAYGYGLSDDELAEHPYPETD